MMHYIFYSVKLVLVIPDRFVLHIWIPGSDNSNQCSYFGILLYFHYSAFNWLKKWWLINVRHTDSDNGLVTEGAQVHEARVYMLVNSLYHHIVCALALKVQRLKDK